MPGATGQRAQGRADPSQVEAFAFTFNSITKTEKQWLLSW